MWLKGAADGEPDQLVPPIAPPSGCSTIMEISTNGIISTVTWRRITNAGSIRVR